MACAILERTSVTPHLNHLFEVYMRYIICIYQEMSGHNIFFYAELTKLFPIIIRYFFLSRALKLLEKKRPEVRQITVLLSSTNI